MAPPLLEVEMFKDNRTRLLLVLIVVWVATFGPSAAATAAESAKPDLEVEKITLDNGLRIFVAQRATSPTFAAIYQFGVGGALDPKGRSGIAHLLEHMMFKGTSHIGTLDPDKEAVLMEKLNQLWHELGAELDAQQDPFKTADEEKIERLMEEIKEVSAAHKELIVKNEYDELMTRAGGVSMNAGTGPDTTSYLIQLPANRLELWFKMEGDRLINPVFREFYSERDVVLSERRQTTENSTYGRMSEALDTLMFTGHPYGTPVIGWPADIRSLTREDAYDYFKTYYSPSNCVMALVGDVRADEVERLAKKYLSGWQQQEIPRLQITAEPEQAGERRRVVEFDAEPQLMMGWVTVPEGHPDQYALDVLEDILGGLWSSRLDRTVVQEERLASSVGTSHNSMRFAGYFYASGTPREGHTVSEIEAAIEREIASVVKDGVSQEELERSKISVEVGRVRRLKSNLGQAFRIAGSVTLTGDTDYLAEYERRIDAVTAEQVSDVAARYLQPNRKSVVELRKAEGAGSGAQARGHEHQRGGAVGERGAAHSAGFAGAMKLIQSSEPVTLTVPEIGKDVQRVELESGVTVFVKEDHSAPSVDMAFAWLGGANTTPVEDLAPFELADQLLTEGGTEALDPFQLQERLDELGMRFTIRVGATQSSASFWSLARNFETTFDLALDMLTRPRLDDKRLQTIKGQYIEQMRRRYDNPWYGGYMVRRHVFDHDHPRIGFQATRTQVEAITAEQIRHLWQRYLGRDNLFVTVVGDFESQEIVQLIEDKLGSWRTAEDAQRVFVTRDPVVKPGVFVVAKELPNPSISLSHHIRVDRAAPEKDHAALEILNDILGGSGFRSRLMERLRSDEGLTYGVYSNVGHQGRPGQPGVISISYQTGKQTVAHSIHSVLEEFHKIIDQDVSSAEVQEQIEAWRNRFIFTYTNDFYSVTRLMYNELDDRPYDFDRQELDAVQKVTVADVRRVAKKYLKPENLSICVFGALTAEDKQALGDELGVTVLDKDVVFSGGYDAAKPAAGLR